MSRAQGKSPYLKLYPYQCLHGSISWQLTPEERCCWYELLCFAALCPERGRIADSDGRPYPYTFIAQEIHTDLATLETTLQKCKEEGRLTEDDNGICITNWKSYQSEYERQKPYREKKKEAEKSPPSYLEGKDLERR